MSMVQEIAKKRAEEMISCQLINKAGLMLALLPRRHHSDEKNVAAVGP